VPLALPVTRRAQVLAWVSVYEMPQTWTTLVRLSRCNRRRAVTCPCSVWMHDDEYSEGRGFHRFRMNSSPIRIKGYIEILYMVQRECFVPTV
jgi:hypothetical protein